MKKIFFAILGTFIVSTNVYAERATYGSVYLNGLSRDGWNIPGNPPIDNAMVCNVNGGDGFLALRSCTGPKEQCPQVRTFRRLAVMQVDTRQRVGNWVRVVGSYRKHDEHGNRLAQRIDNRTTGNGIVDGWMHDGYLCSFLD